MVVHAAPESFRVVAVEIPKELSNESDVRYDVVPRGVRLLSASQGVLHPSRGTAPLMLTVQLPAAAPAGMSSMADVVFVGRALRVTTSIDMNVAARAITMIAAERAVHGARAGDDVEMRFTIRNAGNTRDTLALDVVTPTGWRIQGARRRSRSLTGGSP